MSIQQKTKHLIIYMNQMITNSKSCTVLIEVLVEYIYTLYICIDAYLRVVLPFWQVHMNFHLTINK